jgi:adenylate kinase family enzyme
MLLHRLDHDDCKKGYILDGFLAPWSRRNHLNLRLPKMEVFLSGVIAITVADEVLALRLGDRRVCKNAAQRIIYFIISPK